MVYGLRLLPQELGDGEFFFLLLHLAFKVDGFVCLFGYFELVLRSLEVGLQAVRVVLADIEEPLPFLLIIDFDVDFKDSFQEMEFG